MPPARSGIADYSAFTLCEVARHVDLTIFSTEPTPEIVGVDHRLLDGRAFDSASFDATLVVVGNSHFHFSSLDFAEDLGAPVLAHDTRMFDAYLTDRGAGWLEGLFLANGESSEITVGAFTAGTGGRAFNILARSASPLLLHSATLADALAPICAVPPKVLPFVPYRLPSGGIDQRRIERSRRALNMERSSFHVGIFGLVSRGTKCEYLTVQAAAWLNQWGIPTIVHVVGEISAGERQALEADAVTAGCELRIQDRVPEALFEEYLVAVDAGVQLRANSRLSLSGGVADQLVFGVPTVASQPMLDDHGLTPFARPVATETSALLVAEQLAYLHSNWDRMARCEELGRLANEYLHAHSVERYALTLINALGLAP